MNEANRSSNIFDAKDGSALHIDELGSDSPWSPGSDDVEFTKEEERKIIRKVDIRLVLSLGVLNCIALMDRLNVSAASIAGMTKDMKLNVGYRYSLILLIFFVTYVVVQPPATVLCRKVGPRPFLAISGFTWGVLMIGFGFAKNWVTMIPLRLILGLCEAGFYPGSIYLISTWYTRYEVQKRYSLFYTIGIFASACSGILAYGLMQMSGIGGLAGWRWIFIMEGILTCVIGFIVYFTLLDFPDQALHTAKHFLSKKEIQFILKRIELDRGDAAVEPFNLRKWLRAGADPKVWGFSMIIFCATTVSYAISYFLPIILRNDMGFSLAAAQCLVAPPFGFAIFVLYGSAWVGDKYHIRGPILVFNCVLQLVGLSLMGFAGNSTVKYFGVFLVAGGCSANLPTTWAYQANNIRGQWKRAFCSATLVGFSGIGGIAGSLIFRAQDAPAYRPGIYATLACNALIVLIVAVHTTYFKAENRKADRGEKVLEGSLDFRYTI